MNKRHFPKNGFQNLLLILIFALLVCNTAGCLASRLARCLAFAATAVLNALYEVTSSKCLDSLHGNSPYKINLYDKIISQNGRIVNRFSNKSVLHHRNIALKSPVKGGGIQIQTNNLT